MAKLKEGSTILKSTGEELIATNEETDAKLAEKASLDHTHDDRYYTKSEADTKISTAVNGIPKVTDSKDGLVPKEWIAPSGYIGDNKIIDLATGAMVEEILNDLLSKTHNDLDGKQGGNPTDNEYYHLGGEEHMILTDADVINILTNRHTEGGAAYLGNVWDTYMGQPMERTIGDLDSSKLNKSGGELSGRLTLGPHSEKWNNPLTDGRINLSNGNVFLETINADRTYSFANVPATTGRAISVILKLKMGSTAHAITWPSSVNWGRNGVPESLSVGKTAIYEFITFDSGAAWFGSEKWREA